jgi:carboxypeptidase C (cathepsin A)
MRCLSALFCAAITAQAHFAHYAHLFGNHGHIGVGGSADPAPYGAVPSLPLYGDLPFSSDAGYLTINENSGSYMYYWMFASQNDPSNDPIAVWLQGGPGASSVSGGFMENGPFKVHKDASGQLHVLDNEYSWNKFSNLVFIDNPVGTGFSKTTSGYATNQDDVAADMMTGLTEFFKRYPDLAGRPMFLFGESYAGKYIPAIAYHLLVNDAAARAAGINLSGIEIGDGWTIPEFQSNAYGEIAYTFGLVDAGQRNTTDAMAAECSNLINAGSWTKASSACQNITAYVMGVSGNPNIYDVRTYTQYNFEPVSEYLTRPDVNAAIYGAHPFGSTDMAVLSALNEDLMKPMTAVLPTLMEKIPFLSLSGQFDFICGTVGVEGLYDAVQWAGADELHSAPRSIWKVNGTVAGYARSSGNFTQLLAAGGGHLYPMNQPEAALDMVRRVINHLPFDA